MKPREVKLLYDKVRKYTCPPIYNKELYEDCKKVLKIIDQDKFYFIQYKKMYEEYMKIKKKKLKFIKNL